MAAGAWVPTNSTRADIVNGSAPVPGGSYKMCLLTSASNIAAGSGLFSGVTGEVSNTGYTAGGIAVALTKSGTSTETIVMTTAPIWTAGAANLVAKWAAIYLVAGDILFYALLDSGGADVTATPGNTYTVGANGATVYTLA
jgi:hypothetical protein